MGHKRRDYDFEERIQRRADFIKARNAATAVVTEEPLYSPDGHEYARVFHYSPEPKVGLWQRVKTFLGGK